MVAYDAVIVGAGVVGLSTAYHVKRMHPKAKVLVVDKLGGPGRGNTEKSGSMFRNCFYSSTNFMLANSSIQFYKHAHAVHDVDLRIRQIGYLWLLDQESYKGLEPVVERLRSRGLRYEIYEETQLQRALGLRTRVREEEDSQLLGLVDVDVGIFMPEGGSVDTDMLVRFYESRFRALGGKTRYRTTVKRIVVEPAERLGMPGEPYFWQEARAAGVQTDAGLIKAGTVIVAAGAWAPSLLSQVGIETFVQPRKRQLFVVDAKTAGLKALIHANGFRKGMPFTILPRSHVYVKPNLEEETFWLGYSDDFPREFKLENDPLPEKNFFEFGIYQVLVKYFPQFKGVRVSSSFAGLYAVNTLDAQPVVFGEGGIIVVGGASGSGIMKADAIGRVAEALYSGQEYAELFGGAQIRVAHLGLEDRRVERELLVI